MILLLAQLDLAHRHSLNPGATAQWLRAHQGCSSRPRTVRHGARPYHPDVQEEAAAAAETLSGMGAVSGNSAWTTDVGEADLRVRFCVAFHAEHH